MEFNGRQTPTHGSQVIDNGRTIASFSLTLTLLTESTRAKNCLHINQFLNRDKEDKRFIWYLALPQNSMATLWKSIRSTSVKRLSVWKTHI